MDVTSPTVGVVAWLADVGAVVGAGQPLATVEVMKMEHAVAADVAVQVTGHVVEVGAEVGVDDVLLHAEPAEAVDAGGPADGARHDLEELGRRRDLLRDDTRPEAVARRHDAGARTARQNVADLCDDGTFDEYGGFAIAAQRRRRSLEELQTRTPADGLVTGIGRVHGRPIAVAAYDATVLAGTQGAVNHRKKDRLFALAHERRLPVVLFAEGGGGRPGDTDVLGASFLDVASFTHFARLAGHVPTVAIVHGWCFAGNAALAASAELVVATRHSNLGMAGPAMIEGGGLGRHEPETIGPATMQADIGGVDVLVDDEAAAVATTRHWLDLVLRPVAGSPADVADQATLRDVVPEDPRRAHDVDALLATLSDPDTLLELRAAHAAGLRTAVARLDGRAVGIVANDPRVRGGALDAAGTDKLTWFLGLCEDRGLPVVVLCDTPGFMVGPDVEAEGGVRAAGRLFAVAARLTVPMVAVVVRRAFGLGAMAMFGGHLGVPVATLAWPTGELGPMGLEGAVRLGFRRELEAVTDDAEREQRVADLLALARANASALNVASFGEIDDVIDPADTRARVSAALAAVAPTLPA